MATVRFHWIRGLAVRSTEPTDASVSIVSPVATLAFAFEVNLHSIDWRCHHGPMVADRHFTEDRRQ